MELTNKLSDEIAFYTRCKNVSFSKNTFFITDKSFHEEKLSQPLQTNNKQCKIAVTFPTGFNGSFNVTNTNKKTLSHNIISQ